MLNMALLLRVVNEGDPSMEVGVDIGETTPDPDFTVNEGKPQMHTTLPCILQIDFAFAFQYCIKWLEVKWKPNRCITNLVLYTLLPVLIRICLVMLSYA